MFNIILTSYSQDFNGKTIISVNRIDDSPVSIIKTDNNNFLCLYKYYSNSAYSNVQYSLNEFNTSILKINHSGDSIGSISFKNNCLSVYQLFALKNNSFAVLYRERDTINEKEQTRLSKIDCNGQLIWSKVFKRSFLTHGIVTDNDGLVLCGTLFDRNYKYDELNYSLAMVQLDSSGNTVCTKTFEETTSFSLSACGKGAFTANGKNYYIFHRHYLTEQEKSEKTSFCNKENNGLDYYTQLIITDLNGTVITKLPLDHEGYLQDCALTEQDEILVVNKRTEKDTIPMTNEHKIKRLMGLFNPNEIVSLIKYDLKGNVIWQSELDKQNSLFVDIEIQLIDSSGYIVSTSTRETQDTIGIKSFFRLYDVNHDGKLIFKRDFGNNITNFEMPKIFKDENKNLIVFCKTHYKYSDNIFDNLYFFTTERALNKYK